MRWSQQANRNSIQNPYEIAANTSVSHDFISRHPPPTAQIVLKKRDLAFDSAFSVSQEYNLIFKKEIKMNPGLFLWNLFRCRAHFKKCSAQII